MSRISASTDVFQAVADPTRRALLDRLCRQDTPVNELAAGFAMSRPAISKHLRVLLQAQLVTSTKKGRQQVYVVRPEKLRDVARWIEGYRRFWEANLTSLKNHLEKPK
jgi:DNA-binding transcriptional ArsR family regulator